MHSADRNIRTQKGSKTSKSSKGSKGSKNSNKASGSRPRKFTKTEYHCMNDVCILVRVPSSSTIGSKYSQLEASTKNNSDESLAEYARQAILNDAAENQAKQSYYEQEENPLDAVFNPGYTDEDKAEDIEYDQSMPSTNDDELDEEKSKDRKASSKIDIYDLMSPDCSEFLDPVTFAKELVKKVVSESEANIEDDTKAKPEIMKVESEDFGNMMEGFRESIDNFSFIDTKKSFTSWPTIETFDVETGAYKIDEYISSFDTEEDWMYVIYYQGMSETICSDMYKYQAIFSLPTWKYPIAQATASMYFSIEVCKVKPKHCQVDVTYKYETFGHKRKPGVFDFQEKWLQYILDSKIKFFKTVTY